MHTDVNIVRVPNSTETFIITKGNVETKLKSAVLAIGEDRLGVRATDTGCHSIRATFATILQLSDEKETKIQQHGRWQSDCFKTYMRRNVSNDKDTISTPLSSRTQSVHCSHVGQEIISRFNRRPLILSAAQWSLLKVRAEQSQIQ